MERKVFTEREQIILASLVKDKAGCIENKRTDGTTLQNKNRAWEEITKRYNIQPEVMSKHTSQQLRKLWANLKQKKRKKTTKLRYEMLATDGGLPDKKVEDPVLAIVDDTAPYADVEITSDWDSTAVFESSTAALEALYTHYIMFV
ncbi:hypothetical protein NQ314_002178 [Rhamnusium bicolor]|uniref:Regulatory protein zeste n=1 Tax=Rhamnusium bicolor TaxID=1586634 RepID=A0AAV8ZT74_9CUCU|nr:hypothetical protein NQ314_002178 [Rhamnusium bicolor]